MKKQQHTPSGIKINKKVGERKIEGDEEEVSPEKSKTFVKNTRNSSKQNVIDLLRRPLLSASLILTF